MDFKTVYDCSHIDWKAVSETLKSVGMAFHSPDKHKRAFEASYTTVFIYLDKRLIGFGRAISDGEYQAAIYDCAVWPEYQGQGIGSLIMQSILEQLPNCNIILYATPGMEGFYRKLGFGAMTTGMAVFTTPQAMEKFTE
jgi:GNAT superfamily N-acetyltransferase